MSCHNYKCTNPKCGYVATRFYTMGKPIPQTILCECGSDMKKIFKPIYVVYKGDGFTKQVKKDED